MSILGLLSIAQINSITAWRPGSKPLVLFSTSQSYSWEKRTFRFTLHELSAKLKFPSFHRFIHLAGSNEQRGILSFSYDEDRQRVTYQLENAVPENAKVALRIPFSGKLGDNPKGHFRCSWTKDDKIKYYSATHFEVWDWRHLSKARH